MYRTNVFLRQYNAGISAASDRLSRMIKKTSTDSIDATLALLEPSMTPA